MGFFCFFTFPFCTLFACSNLNSWTMVDGCCLLVLQIMNVMWMLLSRNNNCFLVSFFFVVLFIKLFYKFQGMDKLILSDHTSAPEPTATKFWKLILAFYEWEFGVKLFKCGSKWEINSVVVGCTSISQQILHWNTGVKKQFQQYFCIFYSSFLLFE